MSHLYDELSVNINSFGTFSTIVVLIFFIITFLLYTIYFHKVLVIRYSLLLQVMMVLYLTIFLIMANTTSPNVAFQMTRLLYVVFMILSVLAIFTVSHLAKEKLLFLKIFSILSAILIIGLTYVNDRFMVTREVIASSYYMSIKGPLFPIAIIYILIIGISMIINFYILYKKRPEDMKRLWPIFISIIIFTLYTDFQGVLLYTVPKLKPTLFIPVLLFLFLFLFYIFTEIKQTINDKKALYKAYLYDDLSEVYSRDFILGKIKEALDKGQSQDHYVAMIDIDGFKKINDTYGHLLGDRVLKALGQLLNDINSIDNLPGRLGGDEFIIFFKKCQMDQALKTMKDLLKSYNYALSELNIDISRTKTGLSIGLIPLNNSMELKDVLSFADEAMYDAKKNGKNTIRVLDIKDKLN